MTVCRHHYHVFYRMTVKISTVNRLFLKVGLSNSRGILKVSLFIVSKYNDSIEVKEEKEGKPQDTSVLIQ